MVDVLAGLGLSVKRRWDYSSCNSSQTRTSDFGNSSGNIHCWRYRQYRSQSIFNNLCRIFFHGTAISLFQAHTTMDEGQKRDTPVVPSGHGKITLPVKYTTIMLLTAGLRCPLPERANSRELVRFSS